MMGHKSCDAFFCGNTTQQKYRYCYGCAKSKGLVGEAIGDTIVRWLFWLFILGALGRCVS